MDIKDKIVIITGASKGIGLETARLFNAEGAIIILAARSKEKIQTYALELGSTEGRALAVTTDVTHREQVVRLVDRTIERFGRIDILINNAGQALAGMVGDVSDSDYRKIIELNVFGPLYGMQAVIPKMKAAGGGIIVNVSSMVSKMHIPGLSTYASTKAALNLLSETARFELADEKIRIITIFPRATATDFQNNSLGDQELRRRQRERAAASAQNFTVDTPQYVAEKILEAIRDESPEKYMDA
jgi:NAD(P)-dependent dehydrogenase (short-subunit alcohol dehydrogenase family)